MNEHCLRFAATIGLLLLASHTIAAPISVIDDTGRNISLHLYGIIDLNDMLIYIAEKSIRIFAD